MRLTGRTVIITGAAGGIGAACAQRYAAEGAYVVCVDANPAVAELAQQIQGGSGAATSVIADISTEGGNALAVEAALERTGRLDVFHANAAVQVLASLESTRPADWNSMHQVNLLGAFLGAQAATPAIRDSGGGSLLFTASVLGIVGDAALPAYGALKGGLIALCRSLATSLGPDGIRCNTLCPADIETAMVKDYFDSLPGGASERERIIERYPLRRLGTPEDVAGAAAFLASDDAAFISGTDIVIDGGLLARIY